MFIFFFWRIPLFAIILSADVEGTWNGMFSFRQRGDDARQFFFSWNEGSGYRPWNFLRKRNQMMLFETIFSRLHVLFLWFLGGYFFFFFFAFKVPKWRVCDWGLFSLFRGIMPDQEGSANFPIFFKTFFYENEEFIFSKLIKMTIYSVFSLVTSEIQGIWYWK